MFPSLSVSVVSCMFMETLWYIRICISIVIAMFMGDRFFFFPYKYQLCNDQWTEHIHLKHSSSLCSESIWEPLVILKWNLQCCWLSHLNVRPTPGSFLMSSCNYGPIVPHHTLSLRSWWPPFYLPLYRLACVDPTWPWGHAVLVFVPLVYFT